MTDDENQRRRHLAEMMIKQCDGKTVQSDSPKLLAWQDLNEPLMKYTYLSELRLRIKPEPPEPREWWICVECNGRFAHNHSYHNRHEATHVAPCAGVPIHVREVLDAE